MYFFIRLILIVHFKILTRCCLDTLRLCDLLLILLYEGRKAVPKHNMTLFMGARGLSSGVRRLDTFDGERTHRQLIDCIRSKDTDALVDAVDSGGDCYDAILINQQVKNNSGCFFSADVESSPILNLC